MHQDLGEDLEFAFVCLTLVSIRYLCLFQSGPLALRSLQSNEVNKQPVLLAQWKLSLGKITINILCNAEGLNCMPFCVQDINSP